MRVGAAGGAVPIAVRLGVRRICRLTMRARAAGDVSVTSQSRVLSAVVGRGPPSSVASDAGSRVVVRV